jgi:manganese transport protein
VVFLDPSRTDFVLDRARHFIRGSRAPRSDLSTLRRLVRASNTDVAFTLRAVGLVNMAIMCVAAPTFGAGGSTGDASIEDAYRMLGPLFGGMSPVIFMISLLTSGLSSSVVGTMAGQMISRISSTGVSRCGCVGWQR